MTSDQKKDIKDILKCADDISSTSSQEKFLISALLIYLYKTSPDRNFHWNEVISYLEKYAVIDENSCLSEPELYHMIRKMEDSETREIALKLYNAYSMGGNVRKTISDAIWDIGKYTGYEAYLS